jgi:signal transduction histidine kinase/ActR/RegA family two-component response regulator
MRPPIVPLRVYLLFLVLGAMLPGAVLTAILLAQTISGNRLVIERRLLDFARVDAAALDREFETIIRVLAVLGTSPALSAGDYQAFHAEARRVQLAQPGWTTVLLLSPQGQQLVNTRLPWGTRLTTVYEPDSLRELVREQQPVVGVINIVPPGGSAYGFAVRVPVMRNRRMAFALTAVIEARSLQALVDTDLPATEEWTRTILDPVATVAARSREAERFVGQPATPSFRSRVVASVSEVFPEVSIDGNLDYAALARGRFGWTAGVMVPRGVLDAGTRGSTIALVAGATVVMLGTLAALILISKRLARDLADVASSAEAVAEGREVTAAPAHVTEIQWLQDSLRTTAHLLEEREHERDQEVERAQEARREAEHANQTKDHFLAVLGHELRNPLAPALTALELMKMRDPDVFARERQVLERQVGHMARLVNDLLDVASLARGKLALRRTRTEVRQVVDGALDMARPLMQRHQHTLRVDVPSTGLPLDGDADRLVQVVTNLLTNAARYTPRGGHVSVTARADGGMAEIVCEDDGPGVPADLRSTLFDPFAQGPRTLDRTQGGLGLGLALARTFTVLHGGAIRLEDPPAGHGSRFVVRIPLASADPQTAAAVQPAPATSADVARRVLVVDDNADACDMIRIALEAAGHLVAVASDGVRALAQAAAFDPQIGILDIGLPGMSGYELAQHLRQSHPCMRLIALTGYGQPSDAQAAHRAGFDRHCTKPIEIAVLLAEVEDRAEAEQVAERAGEAPPQTAQHVEPGAASPR